MVNPDLPHSSRLRKHRSSEPGACYLITKNRHPGAAVRLTDPRVAPTLGASIRWHSDQGYAHLLAFVLMPDHVHWLFILGEQRSLDQVMQGFASYTWHQIVPVHFPKARTIWDEEYHDKRLHAHDAIWDAIRYVHRNPVQEGLCERVEQWPWSSANPNYAGWVEREYIP